MERDKSADSPDVRTDCVSPRVINQLLVKVISETGCAVKPVMVYCSLRNITPNAHVVGRPLVPKIDLFPGIAEPAVIHELTHVMLFSYWMILHEGMARYVEVRLSGQPYEALPATWEEIQRLLPETVFTDRSFRSEDTNIKAYDIAYRIVQRLVKDYGIQKVVDFFDSIRRISGHEEIFLRFRDFFATGISDVARTLLPDPSSLQQNAPAGGTGIEVEHLYEKAQREPGYRLPFVHLMAQRIDEDSPLRYYIWVGDMIVQLIDRGGENVKEYAEYVDWGAETLAAAADCHGDSEALWTVLGRLYAKRILLADGLQKGRYQLLSEGALQRALELNPSFLPAIIAGARNLFFIPERYGGDKRKAYRRLHDCLQNDEYSPGEHQPVYETLALFYHTDRRFSELTGILREGLRRFPQSSYLHHLHRWSLNSIR